MLSHIDYSLIALIFLAAGLIKGLIGFGLPTVCLALLVLFLDLPDAMVLLVLPSLVSNCWQTFAGPGTSVIAQRLWPFLLAAFASVWLGALALTVIDWKYLSALLGVLVMLYAVLGFKGRLWQLEEKRQRWLGPPLGVLNGLLTGMTGSFVFPSVLYLQAIGFPRTQMIKAMGMTFLTSTAGLAVALQGIGYMAPDMSLISAMAVLPTLAGMAAGQKLRAGLDEASFRKLFFTGLLLLGGYILLAAL